MSRTRTDEEWYAELSGKTPDVALTELRRRRWRDVSLEELVQQGNMSDFTPEALTDKHPGPAQETTNQMMMTTIQQMIEE